MSQQVNVNLAFTADTSKAKAEINSLQQSLAKISSGVGLTGMGSQMTAGLKEASQAAIQLQTHLQKAVNVNTGTLNFTAFNQSVKNSGTSIQALGESLLKAGTAGQQSFAQLTTAIAKSEVPLTRMGSTFAKFSQTLKNTISWQISSSMIHGFIGAIQGAYGYAKDLNESLNNIRIVTGQSADQMARFAEQANKTAKQLSTTTTKYTNASLIYYQQGLNDQEVKARTDVTMKLANAAGISAEAASTQLTAIWNNFDNGSQSLEHYADVLVKLGAETASSSEEISQGMQKFASVAETVGLSYEYAAAALATVTATTRQSADTVGTAFKTLFARLEGLQLGETLEDGTDLNKYSKALATVGVNIKDTSGEIKNMDTILDELGDKWKTLGKDQQIALAQTVGGMRQYTQLVALMDNWDFFKENVNRAQNADGSLQKQQDIYAESWEAAANRVKAANQAIFQDLLKDKAFIGILNTLEDLLTGIDNFIDGLGGVRGVLLSIGTIATTVFSKKLASGLTMAGQGIKTMFMGPAGIQAQKMAAHQNLIDIYRAQTSDMNYVGRTAADTSQHAVNQQMFANQKMYMMNAANMSADQKMAAQIHLDSMAALGQEKVRVDAAHDNAKKVFGQTQATMLAAKVKQEDLDFFNERADKIQSFRNIAAQAEKGMSQKDFDNYRASLKGRVPNNLLSDLQNEDMGVRQQAANELKARALKMESFGIRSLADQMDPNLSEAERLRMASTYGSHYQDVRTTGETAKGVNDFWKVKNDPNDPNNPLAQKMDVKGVDKVVAASSAVMSLGMAISSAKGIMDAWNNSDLSIGEKLTTTATSGGMAIMMLTSSFKTLQTSFTWLTGGMFTGIIAGVAALVLAIDQISKAYNANAIAAERAAEAAASLKEKNEQAEQKLTNIKNTFASYDELSNKLKNCVKGTEEWKNALEEVNSFALDIAANHPDLASKLKYTRNANGALEISNQEEIVEEAEENAKKAKYAAAVGNISAEQAQVESDRIDLEREYATNTLNWMGINGAGGNSQFQYVVDNAQDYVGKSFTEFSQEVLGSDPFTRKEWVEGANVGSFEDFYNDIQALGQAALNVAEQMDAAADLIVEDKLGNKYSAAEKEVASDAYQKKVEQIEKDILDNSGVGISKWSSKNNAAVEELWRRYSEATGTNYKLDSNAVTGIDNNRYFQYLDNGEQKKVSLEEMAAAIAAAEALNELGAAASTAKNILGNLEDQAGKVSKNSILNYLSDQNFDDITKKEQDSFKKDIEVAEDGTFDPAKSLKYWQDRFGADQFASLAETMGKTVDELATEMTKAMLDIDFSSIGKNLKGFAVQGFAEIQSQSSWQNRFSEMTAAEQQGIAGLFEQAESMAGVEGVQGLLDALKALDDAGISTATIMELLANANITTAEGCAALQAKLEELGIAADGTLGPLDEFIARMKEIANQAQTKEDAQKQFKAMSEIKDKITKKGDVVSQEEMDAMEGAGMSPEEFFQQDAGGDWRFTGDLEEFYNAIDSARYEGYTDLEENAIARNASLNRSVYGTEDGGFSTDGATITSEELMAEQSVDNTEMLQRQAEFMYGAGLMTPDEYNTRMSEIMSGDVSSEIAESMANAISQFFQDHGFENIEEAYDDIFSKGQEELDAMNEAQDLSEYYDELEEHDLNQEDVELRADGLSDIADENALEAAEMGDEDLAARYEALAENVELCREWAMEQERVDRGILSLEENYKNIEKQLDKFPKHSKEWQKAMQEIRGDIADIAGVDLEDISEGFVKAAKDSGLLEDAAKRDQKAIRKLQREAGKLKFAKEIAKQSKDSAKALKELEKIDSFEELEKAFQKSIDDIANQIADAETDMGDDAQEIGDTLRDGFEQYYDWLANAEPGEIPPPDITAMLEALAMALYQTGYSLDSIQALFDSFSGGTLQVKPETADIEGTEQPFSYTTVHSEQPYDVDTIKYTEENTVQGVNVREPTQVTGFSVEAVAGGADPVKEGGGGGGGGGGKAKPPKPHKRIDPKVRFEGTKKRIDNLSKKQDALSGKKESTYGQERIKTAEKEIELKQRQIKLQTQLMEETKEALELQKIDVADRLKNITGVELEFDVDGSIKNLDKVEEAILDIENYIIDLENAEADEFLIAKWQEKLDMAREGFDDLLDIIEETLDAETEFWNAINELNELVLENIQYKVELDISIDEAELEYIDYMLEKLSDEGFDAAESIAMMGQKAGNALSQIEAYQKGISEILATRGISINDLMDMSADDLMGLGFGQAEIDALLEYRSAIIENMTTLNELRNEMVEKVSTAFGVFSDELSRQIDLFEHYSGLLEHFGEIATLTGSRFAKSELRDLFSSMDNAAMANGQANIKAAKARLDSVQAMYDEFMATYDEATASQAEREAKAEMEDALNEAQEDFYATWENTLSKATEILERWVEDAGARFEEALSPMYQSLDRLEEAYERMKEQDENYYDNYEQLYHLSQLTRDISNSIDDTDNIKGKQRLRDLMKEITDIQARGVELSEYDVDILRKRYELEQARQALEDASDNASLVRLQRDQEGNWGYVYTADEDAVDEAEKEYENKLYELQKANDEYIKELQDRILELTTNCKEQLADIAADTTLSPEEKEKLSQEVADFYNSQLEYLTSQMDGALANQNATLGLMLSVYDTTKDQLLDTWGETNLSLLGMYNSTGEMFAGLTGSMKGYMNDLWEGILNFDNNLNNTNIAAGGKDAFEALANEIGKIGTNSESTKESVIALGESFKQEFSEIIDSVTKFENTYDAAINEAINKNEELVMSLLDVISTLALVNSDDQAFTDAYNKYRAAQQKYLEGFDGTVDIGQIRYGLLETENEEWEAAKKEFEEFMREWMTQRSGGITDSGQSYDTGGYTGDWGPEGRLAWLHQKEIVLNAADTENLLDAVAMVRELELNVGTFTDRLSEIVPSIISMGHEAFQQEIYITAEFPDATNAAEIQEAFENLINDAAQYAYSR